jgi:predicted N-acetyltransferase YhbS
MLHLLPEAAEHVSARENLLDRCFGPARHLKTCELLRRGRLPAEGLAFALVDDGELVGTIRFWHINAGSAGSVLLLGPVAVAPERQGESIGSLLIRTGLAEAQGRGHSAVILVGDAPYYNRFGFHGELTENLVLPGPVERNRFLALELSPGALASASGPVTPSGACEMVPRIAAFAAPQVPMVSEHLPAVVHAAAL